MLITVHDIACRIMRKENYLIAMLNTNVLNLTLPVPKIFRGVHPSVDRCLSRARFTKTIEWSIHLCLLDHMFSRQYTVRRAFLDDEVSLRRRFIWAGVVHLAFVPFAAMFMIMHFFLLHAQEWRVKQHYLGPRDWSPLVKWSFREVNELSHVFEMRLSASREPAGAYLALFPQPIVVAFAQCLAFVSGAIVAILLTLAAVLDGGDAILIYVKIGNRNLLWFVGAGSAIFAAASAFVPGEREKNNTNSMADGYDNSAELLMYKIAENTHCFPEEWRGQAHSCQVRDAFACAFRSKVWLFLDEVLSVLFTPFVLCVSLSDSAPDILKFVKENTVVVDGLGSVLSLSRFDCDSNLLQRMCGVCTERDAEGGKLQKSLNTFTLNHPGWAKNKCT